MNPYISAPKNPLYFSLFNLLAFADIAAHSLESGKSGIKWLNLKLDNQKKSEYIRK